MLGRVMRRKTVNGPGAERAGRLFLLGADLLEDRQHLAHDVGERDGGRGHDDARHREDDGDAAGGEPVAEPAGVAVDEDEREADDDGGEGEGDVDERIEQPGAGEAVAGQDERDADAEDRVERDGDGGHEQREPERVQGVRRGEGIPRRAESVLEGAVEHRADGQDDEQGEVAEDAEAQRQAPAVSPSHRLRDVEAPAGPADAEQHEQRDHARARPRPRWRRGGRRSGRG